MSKEMSSPNYINFTEPTTSTSCIMTIGKVISLKFGTNNLHACVNQLITKCNKYLVSLIGQVQKE